MVPLIVVVYPHEYRAEEVLDTLTHLGSQDLVDLDDAWYASRGSDGSLRLHRLIDLPAADAVADACRDALVGSACIGPLLVGAAGETVSRSARDSGISERFLSGLGRALEPESSAILALIRRADPARVLSELVLYGGTVMQTSVEWDDETGHARAAPALSDDDRATVLLAPAAALAAVVVTAGGLGEHDRARLAHVWWDAVRRFSSALAFYPEFVVIESVVDARASAPGDATADALEQALSSCSAARDALAAIGDPAVLADFAAFVRTLGTAAAETATDLSARARAYDVVHEIDALLGAPVVGIAP